MAIKLVKQAPTTQVTSGGPVHIGSYIGPVQVLVTDSTASDADYYSPFTYLANLADGSDSTHILTAPPNATYLTLFHQYVGTLTAAPVVRVYGEIPVLDKQANHPSAIHASYSNPFTFDYDTGAPLLNYENGGFDWIPLCELSTNTWDITVGDPSMVDMELGSADRRSAWTTINLLGVRRVMATIKDGATGITRGVIAGCFGA